MNKFLAGIVVLFLCGTSCNQSPSLTQHKIIFLRPMECAPGTAPEIDISDPKSGAKITLGAVYILHGKETWTGFSWYDPNQSIVFQWSAFCRVKT